MPHKILASGIMTEKVIVAHVGNTFSQVMEFFTHHRIQHLPVADGDKLIGIISVTDMLDFMSHQLKAGTIEIENLNTLFQIENEMTPNPIAVAPDENLESILNVLKDGKFQAVPVVENGTIKGIITNKDIVRVYFWEKMHE